jgi:hypothetical protein
MGKEAYTRNPVEAVANQRCEVYYLISDAEAGKGDIYNTKRWEKE